jgi:hypothetical protein
MKDPFKKSFFEMTPILEIGKYRISYSKDSNSIFCFVEGLADITFYKNFVINYFKDYIIEWFNCGGVFEVLNYYDLAKEQSDNWNKLNKNRFLFFTDKDCSDIQKDSNLRMQDDNIFITQDVYSVDNYLVVEYIVERILEEYFGIEKSHISILKCEFNKVYEQFKEMFSDIVCLDIESRNKNGEIRKLLEKINHNITDEKKVKGFKDIVIIDNFSNSKPEVLDAIRKITGKDFKFYNINYLNKKELEKINKLNEADSLIFQTEKQLEEMSDKLNETDIKHMYELLQMRYWSEKTREHNRINKRTKH